MIRTAHIINTDALCSAKFVIMLLYAFRIWAGVTPDIRARAIKEGLAVVTETIPIKQLATESHN